MEQNWLYSLIAVSIVSLVSLIGIFTLSIKLEKLKKILYFMVSFAAGSLLGSVFIHLLPELKEKNSLETNSFLMILLGFFLFFVLEKIICWRHCHVPTSTEHPHALGIMNLMGDFLHNFTDGMIIGAGFLTSRSLGIATAMAVVFHEIPQEIGDFSVLIYAGFSKGKALLYNFASALAAVLGNLLIFFIGVRFNHLIDWLVCLAAGGFLYIASVDLIPELKKEESLKKSFIQLLTLLAGIGVMALVRH